MRRHFLLFLAPVLALLSAPCLSAQQILPDRFASWTPANRHAVVLWPRSPEWAKYDAHPESTQLLIESGVVRIEEHYYQKGDAEIAIRAFKLRDPSCAYEIYTSRLRSGMMPTNLGQSSAFDKDGVLILVGSLVLDTSANVSKEDLNALVRSVERTSGKAPLPPIPNYLPVSSRSLGTERYALGPAAFRAALGAVDRAEFATITDEIGFDSGAEAMLAGYQTTKDKDNGVLVLVEYPTPQLAEQHLRHLERAIPATEKQAGTTIQRKGSLLSLVLKPSSAAFGESLRNAVRYETEVTWNEPTHKITDPPWLLILGRIIVFTLLFMGLAIAVGAAFGGIRIALKIFFPGKIFDRPGQMDVLQLGLSGKRIDSRDFY